jgi:hypothetical protein
MMRKYVKKPVVIEAVKWTGNNVTEIVEFCVDCYSYTRGNIPQLMVRTLEGPMKATDGDYIIKGVKGEFYPCKPDVFELTYDEVTNQNQ